jgi:hypothetical protein
LLQSVNHFLFGILWALLLNLFKALIL